MSLQKVKRENQTVQTWRKRQIEDWANRRISAANENLLIKEREEEIELQIRLGSRARSGG